MLSSSNRKSFARDLTSSTPCLTVSPAKPSNPFPVGNLLSTLSNGLTLPCFNVVGPDNTGDFSGASTGEAVIAGIVVLKLPAGVEFAVTAGLFNSPVIFV